MTNRLTTTLLGCLLAAGALATAAPAAVASPTAGSSGITTYAGVPFPHERCKPPLNMYFVHGGLLHQFMADPRPVCVA